VRIALPQRLSICCRGVGFNMIQAKSRSPRPLWVLNMLCAVGRSRHVEPWIGRLSSAIADGVVKPVVHCGGRSPSGEPTAPGGA